jgi:hypothetical protein
LSHFTVIVALENPTDVDKALAEALAPFDENKDVTAYNEYESGEPAEHWIYEALKRHADEHATGTGIKPYDPNASAWSSNASRHTVEEQREELERLAGIYHSLRNPPTWEDIVHASTTWFGEDSDLKYEHETGRAYTVSTYNPESKWDWYQVGGRWTGYFKVKSIANRVDIINGTPGIMTTANRDVSRCDGGKKANLDINGMRDEKGDEAAAAYDRYHALMAGWPEAKPWAHFRALVEAEEGDYTIEQAREDYASQSRVKIMRDTEFDSFMGPDAIEEYAKPRELLIEEARAKAVPGYAVLTHDGKWLAPGKMGWFGMSSDDDDSYAQYLEYANKYLDALSDDVWLVQVDCHI